jgi:tRNA 2-thiouridine synthesizing protein A
MSEPEGVAIICALAQRHRPMQTIDREVDARGLNCPLPVLRTKKALNDMKSGQVLRITATDPGSVRDFEAFSRQTGNQLLDHGEADGAFWFLLKRR